MTNTNYISGLSKEEKELYERVYEVAEIAYREGRNLERFMIMNLDDGDLLLKNPIANRAMIDAHPDNQKVLGKEGSSQGKLEEGILNAEDFMGV